MSFRNRKNQRSAEPRSTLDRRDQGAPPASALELETDRRSGRYRGRAIARTVMSPDGFVVLVGKSANDNDVLSLKLGRPYDFWLHASGVSGSHVVVLNDQRVDRLPRATAQFAAGLAAGYSKARAGGRVSVHLAQCSDVSKRRGAPAGEVSLRRYQTVHAEPRQLE